MLEMMKPWHGFLTILSYVVATVYNYKSMLRAQSTNYIGALSTLVFVLFMISYTRELRRDRDKKILVRITRVYTLFIFVGFVDLLVQNVEASFSVFLFFSYTFIVLHVVFGACVYGLSWLFHPSNAPIFMIVFGIVAYLYARKQLRKV